MIRAPQVHGLSEMFSSRLFLKTFRKGESLPAPSLFDLCYWKSTLDSTGEGAPYVLCVGFVGTSTASALMSLTEKPIVLFADSQESRAVRLTGLLAGTRLAGSP